MERFVPEHLYWYYPRVNWVAPVDDSFLYNTFATTSTKSFATWPFFKVNPNTLDNIFAVKADSTWETDQFLVNSYVGCKVGKKLIAKENRDARRYN